MIKEANVFLEMGVEKIAIFKQKQLHSAVSAENSEICGGQDLSNRVVCQAFGIKAVQVKLMQRQRIITVLNIFPSKNSKKVFCKISTGLWMSQGHRQNRKVGSECMQAAVSTLHLQMCNATLVGNNLFATMRNI